MWRSNARHVHGLLINQSQARFTSSVSDRPCVHVGAWHAAATHPLIDSYRCHHRRSRNLTGPSASAAQVNQHTRSCFLPVPPRREETVDNYGLWKRCRHQIQLASLTATSTLFRDPLSFTAVDAFGTFVPLEGGKHVFLPERLPWPFW
jgi:hypothetical protein